MLERLWKEKIEKKKTEEGILTNIHKKNIHKLINYNKYS
jgi:hypothetical protein